MFGWSTRQQVAALLGGLLVFAGVMTAMERLAGSGSEQETAQAGQREPNLHQRARPTLERDEDGRVIVLWGRLHRSRFGFSDPETAQQFEACLRERFDEAFGPEEIGPNDTVVFEGSRAAYRRSIRDQTERIKKDCVELHSNAPVKPTPPAPQPPTG